MTRLEGNCASNSIGAEPRVLSALQPSLSLAPQVEETWIIRLQHACLSRQQLRYISEEDVEERALLLFRMNQRRLAANANRFRRVVHRVLESAKLVDELQTDRLLPRPHAAAG